MIYKFLIVLILIFLPQISFPLTLSDSVLQGALVIGQDANADQVFIDGKIYRVSKNGYFVFPIDRDQEKEINVTLLKRDKVYKIYQVSIIEREFDIQEINGLPSEMVTPSDDVLKRIIEENKIIKDSKKINTDYEFFINKFIIPVDGIISGIFGSQRILNGKPKSPHRGLDIAANEGTLIKSTNDGEIILAEDDLYYTGGTIIVDHGYGVKSIYAHLSRVDVKVNDMVSQNDILGTVGSTGRSTGPHLHWGVMVFDTYVDPELLLTE